MGRARRARSGFAANWKRDGIALPATAKCQVTRQKPGLRVGYSHALGRGTYRGRHFQDGENREKGQLLFVIDPRPCKAQVDSAQAVIAQAKAALDLAQIQFARAEEGSQSYLKAGL